MWMKCCFFVTHYYFEHALSGICLDKSSPCHHSIICTHHRWSSWYLSSPAVTLRSQVFKLQGNYQGALIKMQVPRCWPQWFSLWRSGWNSRIRILDKWLWDRKFMNVDCSSLEASGRLEAPSAASCPFTVGSQWGMSRAILKKQIPRL